MCMVSMFNKNPNTLPISQVIVLHPLCIEYKLWMSNHFFTYSLWNGYTSADLKAGGPINLVRVRAQGAQRVPTNSFSDMAYVI